MLSHSRSAVRKETFSGLLVLAMSIALLGLGTITTTASTFAVAPLTLVSGPTPFTNPGSATSPGCNGALQTGKNFPNAEVEPYVAISPANSQNIVGVWQQDRWSNGGANGLLAGVSHNGGTTWSRTFAHFSRCAGGNAANNGDFERASDPWVSIAPDGTVFQVAISFNDSNPINAVAVSRSTNGGDTWENPILLKFDPAPTVFNDKESVTADPVVNGNAYVVWDRLVFPTERARGVSFEHAVGFHGPAWFARTTNGGASWEPARIIFDPGEQDQTIGNEIVVLPDRTLIDGFNLIFNRKNVQGERGFNVAVIRSPNQGVTWSSPIVVSKLLAIPVLDPNTGALIRTGDILPEFAVDPSVHPFGILYAVWQDARFSGFVHDDVAFSLSTDGGLTWTAPVKINKTPNPNGLGLSNIPAFTPSVHVAADGTVAVTYYDFRNLKAGNITTLPTDYWIIHCHAHEADCREASNWAESHISGPFDMLNAPFARGFFVGDYEGMTHMGEHSVRPFFVQTNAPCSGQACMENTTNRNDVFTTTAGPAGGF